MLEWELYKCLIDEIGDYLFHIELHNWGEPLLHKQTPEFIRYAKSKEIKVVVHTNLSINLSDEYIQDLVRSGLDQLVISADGASQETYEKYRRGGNISLVRNNMERIQAEKGALGFKTPEILWKFLVFKHNEHEIARVRTIYKDWGADGVIIGGPYWDSNMLDAGIALSSIPEYTSLLRCQAQVLTKTGHKRRLPKYCSFLYEALTLNADGSMSPCCSISNENDDFAKYSPSIGFLSAWNSDRFRIARSITSKSEMLLARKDKPSDGVVNVCQKCQVRFVPYFAELPERVFRQCLYERASLFLQQKDLHYLPDFPLKLCIADYPTVIRNLLSIIGRRLSKHKNEINNTPA
jgi:predicted transcriptional regulator